MWSKRISNSNLLLNQGRLDLLLLLLAWVFLAWIILKGLVQTSRNSPNSLFINLGHAFLKEAIKDKVGGLIVLGLGFEILALLGQFFQ